MKNFTKLFLICLLFLFGFKGNAQITPGDFAIIGFNGGNDPAELAIVALSTIPSGQTIYITDRGWHATDGFALANTFAEGLITWTTTAAIPAGTILKVTITALPALSISGLPGTVSATGWSGLVTAGGGDNWFIYTGPVASPSFIYAFANWATNTPDGTNPGSPWQNSGNVNATTSYLPSILAAGNFSTALTGSTLHADNNAYTGTITGTKAQILASLAAPAQWSSDESTPKDLTPGGGAFPGTNPIFQLPPSVASVSSSTADGSYKAGSVISIEVTFSTIVNVNGTPKLALNTGVSVDYKSGTGTNVLTFEYTIAANQNSLDLDYATTVALGLNGGSIRDVANNQATLTLPAPGASGSLGVNKAIVIDTQAPLAPSTPVLAASSDKGTSNNDKITNLTTPVITGTAESGATVTLYDTDGSTTLGIAVATAGNWSMTSSTLMPGSHILTAKAKDLAGNVSVASTDLTITIDTTTPTLAITTNVSSLKAGETATITFTFSEDPSTSFTWNGTTGSIVVSGGTLSAISGAGLTRTATFTPTAATNAGTASITVAAASYTDIAGNNGAGAPTPTLNFDTQSPVAPSTPALAASSDSGTSNTDKITNVTTPVVSGTAEAGTTVNLYDTDGTTLLGTAIATGGNWSIPSSALSDGTHTLTVKATDATGNVSVASTGLAITIDTTSPTLAITSNRSNLKAGETATITFTFSEDPSTSFTSGSVIVSGGSLGPVSGSGLTRTATFTPTVATNNGTASITVTAASYTDIAGNNGAGAPTPTLTFDTQAPAAPSIPVLAASSDSGTSNSDRITNATTPVITGTAEIGTTITLFDTDGTTILGTKVAADGTWSITSSTLTSGSHTLSVKATDIAGNTSVSSTGLTITIDTTSPTVAIVSNVPTLNSGQTATITFTFNENPGTTFNWDGSTGSIVVTGGTLGAISGSGLIRTATFTPATGINNGTVGITVTAGAYTDAAGNNGTAGISPTLTFDTKAASLTAVNIVSNNAQPTFAKIGNTVNLTFTSDETIQTPVVTIAGNAVTPTAAGNNWTASYVLKSTDPEGLVTYNITFNDLAGNAGIPVSSGTGTVTFDKTVPAAPGALALAASSDSGTSNSDRITNVATPVITGTAEIGTTITLFDTDGTTILGTKVAADGTWSITSSTLSSGSHTLSVKATDIAGNTSVSSTGLTITIDTTSPTVTIVSNVPTLNSGQTATITFTFNENPGTTFTWDGSTGSIVVTGGTLGALSGSGLIRTATFTPATGINNGTVGITVTAGTYTDVAGNNGTAGISPTLTFDTKAASLTAVNIVSNNAQPTFAKIGNTVNLTFTSDETIQTPVVTIAGNTVTPTAAGNNWTASYVLKSTDPEGFVAYNITFNDLSGNAGIPVSSGTGTVTFDKTAPASPAGLAATPGNTQVVLNWTASPETDLAKYRIFFGTSANPTTPLIDIVAGTTTYTHTALTNGTTYYYRIQAIDKADNASTISSPDVTAVPKANQTITFNAIAAKTYGDAAFQLGNATSSAGLTVTYTATDPLVVSIAGNTATILKAGSTTITATQAGNGSFNAAPTIEQTLTVNTKALTITSVNINKVYGDLLNAGSFTGNISGLVNGDNITATRNSTGAGVTANVNTYPITAIPVDPNGKLANYAVTNTPGVLTVNQKPLTITAVAKTKTYGDVAVFASTEFTQNGLINGNTVTSVTLNSAGAIATAAVSGSPYLIIPSLANGNGLGNYAITYANAALTVDRKALTVTAEDKEKFAGTANPPLTVKYSAFANGETNAVFTTQPTITTTATVNSPIGDDYPITASGAVAANYSFTYVPGKLKIKPGAPTSITLAGVTLYENSPATTNAGTLSSTSDDPSATFTYTLVAGTGDTDNSSFAIAGNKINTTAALNFENKSSYSVRVRSTTQYGLFLDKVLNITLSDVNEIPTLAAISNQTICFTTAAQTVALSGITAGPETGQIINLTVSSNNAALFETLNVTGSGATATLTYRIKAGAIAGTATVTVTVKDNGGTANGGVDTYSRNFVITVNALPVISINSDKGLEISKGESVLLSATGGTSYAWLAHSSIKGSLNSATIEVRPRETTTYTVTVTNASGCSETKTFTLTVLDDYMKVKATNILTPNNDGHNDKWLVDNIDFYPNNEVKIFDKAGRLMYSKKGYDNSWDGTFNGTALAEGTYYYIIDFGTRQRVFKGFITIVRND